MAYERYRTPTPSPQSTHAVVRSTACKCSHATQVTIDGNNACSRCMTWLWMRGTANTKRKHILRGIGAFAARSGPVLLAATFIRTTRSCKDKYGKLLVLVVFLHRNGCAGLLMRTARTARKGMDSPSYIGGVDTWPAAPRRSPRLNKED